MASGLIISTKQYSIPTIAGDTREYFEPVEYLIKQGTYWWDCRMPGYGLIYGLFRMVTKSEVIAQFCMVAFALAAVIAALAISLWYISTQTDSLWALHSVGFVWTTAMISHGWITLLPDTTVAAINVIVVILLLREKFLLSGILLTYMIFSRPASGTLLAIVALYIGLAYRGWPNRWKVWLLTFLPFIIAETAWVTRNFIRYGDFRPFHGTRTLYHATSNEPLWTAFRTFQVLGLSGDSRALFMLWGGWPVDTQAFFALLPQKYLSHQNKSDLTKLFLTVDALKHTSEREDECSLKDSITRLGKKIEQEVYIPPLVRRGWRIYSALFTDLFYFAVSPLPKDWIPHLFHHPLYAWNSLSFLLGAFLSTIGLGLYLRRTSPLIKPQGLLWYGFGIGVPLTHVILDLALEQRYLSIYTPTLGVSVIFFLTQTKNLIKTKKER